MKGIFFARPLEWNLETTGESWQQGETLQGVLKVKNHGTETVDLKNSGVALAPADIKKVQARAEGALKPEKTFELPQSEIPAGAELSFPFRFEIGPNSPVTDKKSSYYLAFGKGFSEGQLQVKVGPKALYLKIIGLLDTFQRFKLKEFKTVKKGVEFKMIPPTSREMASIESLLLTFSMTEQNLVMKYEFQVKKLDTSSIKTKINKESLSFERSLSPKEYSLGKDLINQDQLLKSIEHVLSEVKLKNVF
jgi:hypothetical protein